MPVVCRFLVGERQGHDAVAQLPGALLQQYVAGDDGIYDVQISQELFFLLVRYFLIGQEEAEPEIVKALEKKIDALVMRELYTQYKTAPTEEEKEKARREYLNRRGVPDSFRW